MPLSNGIQLVLQHPDATGKGAHCRGFVGLPATASYYLLVAPINPLSAASAHRLGAEIAREILTLGPNVREVSVPCGGSNFWDCHATNQPDCIKCLIPIVDAAHRGSYSMPRWAARTDAKVIPVVAPALAQDLIPASLQALNQIPLVAGSVRTLNGIFRAVGLFSEKPRIFISYARLDTSDLAEQLHDELTKQNFEVFLDRFSVEPGADFQSRLNEELVRMGTILLLESPQLSKSKWVRHEVDFALLHRLGIVALQLPGGKATGGIIPDNRITIPASSLTKKGMLKKHLIDQILSEISKAQTLSENTQINYLTGTLSAALSAAGFTSQSFSENQVIVATGPKRKEYAIRVSSLPPELVDFQILDHYSQHGTGQMRESFVIAPTAHMDWRRRSPIDWLGNRVGMWVSDESQIADLPKRLT